MVFLKSMQPDLAGWKEVIQKISKPKNEVDIALVGKYIDLKESYKSLVEALHHGGIGNDAKVNIRWVDAEKLENQNNGLDALKSCNGVLVPGGFGERGMEGKIKAVNYARINKLPFFGICLGMHCATIEFARDVAHLKNANSGEIAPKSPYLVIDLMSDQDARGDKGGTMRLGEYPCQLRKKSFAYKAYGKTEVYERHRHRYEFNNKYRMQLEDAGLKISGLSPNGNLVEIIELEDHPWFLAGQFHPEFKSSPMEPHPLFREFIASSIKHRYKPSKEC